MNHIENMGWITSFIFTESSKDYNIAKYFGQVKIETIETEYQALEISTQPTDNIKKLKSRGLYTWFFNSSDESAQDFLISFEPNSVDCRNKIKCFGCIFINTIVENEFDSFGVRSVSRVQSVSCDMSSFSCFNANARSLF